MSPNLTIDLHVRTAASLHQVGRWYRQGGLCDASPVSIAVRKYNAILHTIQYMHIYKGQLVEAMDLSGMSILEVTASFV